MIEIPPEFLPFHNAELVVGSFSLIANVTLLYVILFKTPKELLEYRPFVFMVTLADFLFDVYVIFLVRPVMIFPALAAIITGPIKVFGQNVAHYFVMLSVFLFNYCMICINLAFFYRYTCIAQKSFHHIFMRRRTQIISHVISIGFVLVVMIYPMTQRENYGTLVHFVEGLIPTMKGHVDELVIVAVESTSVWMFVNLFASLLPSCTLNAVLAYLIVKKLRSFRSSFSAATYRMHLRLVACLMCQAFGPIILLAFPILITIYYGLADSESPNMRLVSSTFIFTIGCHPLMNALFTIYFVQPYRRAIIKDEWIRFVQSKLCWKVNNSTGHPSTAPGNVAMEIKGQLTPVASMPHVNGSPYNE